jgi:hypothetical protein
MVLFDIVIYESWYALVELLPHAGAGNRQLGRFSLDLES